MSNIKAGGVFVEIGADPRQFFRTLNRVNKAMANMGRSLASAGAKVGGMGVATLAPFAAAVRAGAGYQNTLLNIQASTGATAAELDRLKAASMEMSAAMGRGPTEVAGAFLELLKAGMSVEQVLGGAGKAAIEFAAVGQMDVAEAAVVMADAMNVFGVDASKAANSISAAADASSTSIELMAQSFAQVSAVAAVANQSIDQTSAALAILANNGVKGSDAGTSVKTMLMRLMAPADDAVTALGQLGLSVQSFRNADGTMKPLVDIIGVLNGALGNMDQAAKDDIFRRIFGQDAIRAAAILTSAGVDGFNAMTTAMGEALPVGEKYKTLMSGLAGAGQQVMAAMQRFAIAVSDAVGPALMSVVTPLVGFINGLTDLASKNKEAVANIAKFGVAAIAIGGALTGLGLSIKITSIGLSTLSTAFLAIPFAIVKAAASLGAFVFSALAAGVSSAVSAASVATAWGGSALAGVLAFVGQAVSAMAAYIASCATAAAATVVDAMAVAAGWLSAALPGVLAFVAGAVSGIASYVASCVAAVAASVASAAAVAAAWLAPLAPFLAIGAAIAGVGALVYSFRDQLSGAFSGVAGMVGSAAEAIGGGFNQAAADGMVVLGDLATTATTTFNGIYEAISAGDLSGAMDILWAGLYAGWLRGSEALMNTVDPWISMFQNAFTILGAEIYKTWDWLWTRVSGAFNTVGAVIQGAMDNVINGVLAAWDTLEAGIRKSWNYIQSFFTKGFDLKKENEKVDNEMDARERQRELERPGVEGRTKQAREENAKAEKDRKDRAKAVDENTQATVDEREGRNQQRRDERRAATQAAENNVTGKTRAAREQRGFGEQYTRLLDDIQNASSLDQYLDYYGEFDALMSNGKLSTAQVATMEAALQDAQERISKGMSTMGGPANRVAENAAAGGAGSSAANQTQAQTVGTFSSVGLGGMGFGASLAQKQLDTLKKIEENTREGNDGAVQE